MAVEQCTNLPCRCRLLLCLVGLVGSSPPARRPSPPPTRSFSPTAAASPLADTLLLPPAKSEKGER
uniref:Uncharacterized protein n=1 Tax=Oryza rufipogon TaxID=4529 RepID=A0A0E0N8S5_ORYRU